MKDSSDLLAGVRHDPEAAAGGAAGQREHLLLIAVLEEAVTCYRRYAGARDEEGRQLFEETEEWFESSDRSTLFSFESICDALGLDPSYVRRGLHDWRARARPAVPQRPAHRARPRAGTRHRGRSAPAAARQRARGGRQ